MPIFFMRKEDTLKDFLKRNALYLFEVGAIAVGFLTTTFANPPNKDEFFIAYCILFALATIVAIGKDDDSNGGGMAVG